jgi:NAD(P)-dependent dehydrogenase (short-subunit alcohol dehydrogenase family)
MAKVLVIGASRGVGLETLRAALRAGHSVRALARSVSSIRLQDTALDKVSGDAHCRPTGGEGLERKASPQVPLSRGERSARSAG